MDKIKTQRIIFVFMVILALVAIALINRWIAAQIDEIDQEAVPVSDKAVHAQQPAAKVSQRKPETVKIDPSRDPLAPRKKEIVIPSLKTPQLLEDIQESHDPALGDVPILVQ